MKRRHLLQGGLWLVTGGVTGIARAGDTVDWFRYIELDLARDVRQMLAEGFDVNTLSPRGQSGLYLALREGSLAVAAVLLAAPGIAFDTPNPAGETPLMMAAMKGHVALMAQLMAMGAQVNRRGWTPLHYAAAGGQAEAIELLLSQGADLEAVAPNGNTPLMMAAGFGTIDTTRLLLRRGADPRPRNQGNRQAADYALSAGRDGLADELREAVQSAHWQGH